MMKTTSLEGTKLHSTSPWHPGWFPSQGCDSQTQHGATNWLTLSYASTVSSSPEQSSS